MALLWKVMGRLGVPAKLIVLLREHCTERMAMVTNGTARAVMDTNPTIWSPLPLISFPNFAGRANWVRRW